MGNDSEILMVDLNGTFLCIDMLFESLCSGLAQSVPLGGCA